MSDHLQRLSQSIKAAAEVVDKEVAQRNAALVVNSVEVMSAPKRQERTTQFQIAVDKLADTIGQARERLATKAKANAEVATLEAPHTLAELLSQAAQDSI